VTRRAIDLFVTNNIQFSSQKTTVQLYKMATAIWDDYEQEQTHSILQLPFLQRISAPEWFVQVARAWVLVHPLKGHLDALSH